MPLFLGMTLFLGMVGIGFFSPAPPLYLGAAGAFGVSILLIVFLIGLIRNQLVRSAFFYESHFKVSGKIPERAISYSEIEGVSLIVKPYSFLILGRQVRIRIRGERVPLDFHSNPKNRILGMDLYTWLLSKTQPAS